MDNDKLEYTMYFIIYLIHVCVCECAISLDMGFISLPQIARLFKQKKDSVVAN